MKHLSIEYEEEGEAPAVQPRESLPQVVALSKGMCAITAKHPIAESVWLCLVGRLPAQGDNVAIACIKLEQGTRIVNDLSQVEYFTPISPMLTQNTSRVKPLARRKRKLYSAMECWKATALLWSSSPKESIFCLGVSLLERPYATLVFLIFGRSVNYWPYIHSLRGRIVRLQCRNDIIPEREEADRLLSSRDTKL